MAAPKLQEVYENAVVELEASNNYMKPRKANVLLNMANREFSNTLFGTIWQTPDPLIGAQKTSDVGMFLRPFWNEVQLTPSNGGWIFPPGLDRFGKLLDLRLVWGSGVVGITTILTNPQYRDRLISDSQPPTEQEAIAEYAVNGFNIAPTPKSVNMLYYKSPKKIVVPFVDNVPDFETIEDIEWDDRAIPYLTYLVIRNFGIPVQNPGLIQIGAELSKMSI